MPSNPMTARKAPRIHGRSSTCSRRRTSSGTIASPGRSSAADASASRAHRGRFVSATLPAHDIARTVKHRLREPAEAAAREHRPVRDGLQVARAADLGEHGQRDRADHEELAVARLARDRDLVADLRTDRIEGLGAERDLRGIAWHEPVDHGRSDPATKRDERETSDGMPVDGERVAVRAGGHGDAGIGAEHAPARDADVHARGIDVLAVPVVRIPVVAESARGVSMSRSRLTPSITTATMPEIATTTAATP